MNCTHAVFFMLGTAESDVYQTKKQTNAQIRFPCIRKDTRKVTIDQGLHQDAQSVTSTNCKQQLRT